MRSGHYYFYYSGTLPFIAVIVAFCAAAWRF